MSNIAIALPYAVSIRDFVHSGTLDELLRIDTHKYTIYTLNPDVPELDEVRRRGVDVLPFRPHVDGRGEKLVKRIYPYFFADQFERVRIQLADKTLHRVVAAAAVGLRRVLGARRVLSAMSGVLQALYRRKGLPPQLNPGLRLLIGTRSLINSLDYGLMAEATLMGIPLMTIAGSWDNFTTKGYFPFPARRTVVWNEKMRRELRQLFDVEDGVIEVAGYPRANLLRARSNSQGAQEYLESIGIHGYKRFVLYSASYGELTRVPGHPVPLEYVAIRQICEQMQRLLPSDVCVLIRFHPYSSEEDREYFRGLDRCHVFVPGRQDQYVERVMNSDDEIHLAAQIAKAECLVSMASTMSIDALCLRKPILNIAFDPCSDLPWKHSICRFYTYNHFRDLISITKLPLAKSVEDVNTFIESNLTGNYISPVDYAQFEKYYVPHKSSDYPLHVSAAIEKVIKNG